MLKKQANSGENQDLWNVNSTHTILKATYTETIKLKLGNVYEEVKTPPSLFIGILYSLSISHDMCSTHKIELLS